MRVQLSDFNDRLQGARGFEQQIDCAAALAAQMGFDAVIYDFSPVATTHDGALITPSILVSRNTPADWHALWSMRGYYQLDPVQHFAVNNVSPFAWSYRPSANTVLQQVIEDCHAPVVSYLHDSQMTCGVTVPIHMPKSGFATFTGLFTGTSDQALEDARHTLGDFSLLAHAVQTVVYPEFDKKTRSCPSVTLTRRERECLKWAADGLTAKEIALHLNRSQATVTLHLNSAMHKLQAKNRIQAVVRASHYRLLDN